MTKFTRATSKFWVGGGSTATPKHELIMSTEDDGWLNDSGEESMKHMIKTGARSGKNMWMSSPSSKMSTKVCFA